MVVYQYHGKSIGIIDVYHAPLISQLFFADDCIIFCRVTREECRQVSSVLEIYEKELGQKLNREKTSLFL